MSIHPTTYSRQTTRGNKPVDFTQHRGQLKNINPTLASTLARAVPKDGNSPKGDEFKEKSNINYQKLESLSNVISNNINAATDLRQITPYIDKAEIIWQTLLLYPNGQQDRILQYDTENSGIKNAKLHTELLGCWEEYFTNDYRIERDLKRYISDIMWNTGSYVLLNLSRPSLDYLINGSELTHIQGTESLTVIRSAINEHFEKDAKGRYLTRNLGKYVRNPNDKNTINNVTGIEALFGTNNKYVGNEFKLFDGVKSEDGKESLDDLIDITLTDNPAILYLQKIDEINRTRDINMVTGAEDFSSIINSKLKADSKPTAKPPKHTKSTTENLTTDEMMKLTNEIFPSRHVQTQDLQFVKTPEQLAISTYGRGLTWHVPSEAVIPIHYNGSVGQKMDYIILLGENGEFLKNTDDFNYYQSLSKNKDNISNQNKTGSNNDLITQLKQVQQGSDCDFDMTDFIEMAKTSILKRFMSAVVSGRGDDVSITLDEEVNKIFLTRMFRRQAIRCLYVPGECVTYMAFKYNRLGTGQSLTQSAKMHIARLAAYDLADTLANLEAAQPHTQLTITPEDKDPDPMRSIAIARSTFFESNPRLHSILSTAQLSIPQIVDSLREASLTIKINPGENPHMVAPEMEFSPMEKQIFKSVDDSSRQYELNQIANYFHLPRSWLDVSDDQNNFQVEAIAENQMLLNQTVNYQDELALGIMDFERKHVKVNRPLLDKLIQIIVDNKTLWKPDNGDLPDAANDGDKVNIILTDFVSNVFCELPHPTSTESTNKLKDSLDAVNELVDKWIEMSGDIKLFEPILSKLGIVDVEGLSAEDISNQVKALFTSMAFKRYNLPMPFDDILNDGKHGGVASLINDLNFQRNNVTDFLFKFIEDTLKEDKKSDRFKNKLAKLLGVAEPEEGIIDDQSESPTPGEDGDTGGTEDDFGGGADAVEDETETSETDEEETETSEEEEEVTENIPEDDGTEKPADPENPFGE